jgi:hypothetical protein
MSDDTNVIYISLCLFWLCEICLAQGGVLFLFGVLFCFVLVRLVRLVLGFGFWAASKVVAGSHLGLACEIVGALAEEVCIILDTVRIY